jgi:PAS domain S-box-containing protein
MSTVLAEPILILAPTGRDASVIGAMLADAGLSCEIVHDSIAAGAALDRSAGLIVAEEAVIRAQADPISAWIAHQPSWSDMPVILLTMRGGSGSPNTGRLAEGLGNVTILERPLHPVTLISAARSAVRARGRQRQTEMLFGEVHRANERLRESERRFRSMANSAPALIWVTDAAGRVVFANHYHEEFFGLDTDRMLGSGWQRTIHHDDLPRFLALMDAALAERRPFRLELRVIDREGGVRWVRCDAVPRMQDGNFIGYIGCGVDVTDARTAADVLEQRIQERTQELEATNRQLVREIEERERVETVLSQAQRLEAVGQLTSGVAHDFNNLLTVVLGNLHFLERDAASPNHQRRLAMMRVAAERGAQLTAQLLAFSRRQRLEPKSVDLNESVKGMRELLQSTMGGSVRIETVLGRGLWPALVDPTQMELVILNLAINARDAMEVGGSLTVETANVTVIEPPRQPEEPGPGEYVLVSVTDTGSGMPAEVLAKAFEPFFTTKGPGKGSGLGLSQVLGFAKQSGGGVRIDTVPGEGTSVKVYVPRAAGEPSSAHNNGNGHATGNGQHAEHRVVLVVDDDSAVRSVTGAMLAEMGCSVLEAGSGGAALDVLARVKNIDLALIDFAMPGMNGLELAREIRARRPGLPLLFVTGYADLTALKEVGEEFIVQKPFRGDELARKLDKVLGAANKVVPLRPASAQNS